MCLNSAFSAHVCDVAFYAYVLTLQADTCLCLKQKPHRTRFVENTQVPLATAEKSPLLSVRNVPVCVVLAATFLPVSVNVVAVVTLLNAGRSCVVC